MGISKNSGTPKSSILIGFPYKPSILGYHYFWKHPNGHSGSKQLQWHPVVTQASQFGLGQPGKVRQEHLAAVIWNPSHKDTACWFPRLDCKDPKSERDNECCKAKSKDSVFLMFLMIPDQTPASCWCRHLRFTMNFQTVALWRHQWQRFVATPLFTMSTEFRTAPLVGSQLWSQNLVLPQAWNSQVSMVLEARFHCFYFQLSLHYIGQKGVLRLRPQHQHVSAQQHALQLHRT